jgi:hypothetical protein
MFLSIQITIFDFLDIDTIFNEKQTATASILYYVMSSYTVLGIYLTDYSSTKGMEKTAY